VKWNAPLSANGGSSKPIYGTAIISILSNRLTSRFEDNGHGEFAFGAVNGGLDCEYSRRIIFFTWQGFDEMDEVSGDGSAELGDDGSLEVEFRFHLGDEALITAHKW
jgi:hypothetical protein